MLKDLDNPSTPSTRLGTSSFASLGQNLRISDIFLLISVFFTGLVVLVIEIVAIRMLSPYYGNTIYTASAVLGIVLMALSLGYYFGGRLSDKYPHFKFFYFIIFVSGLLTLGMYVASIVVLPTLSLLFSIIVGPLVASFFLFLIPALALGMLSPFAVKLHHNLTDKTDKVGQQSGEVFFWSTLGSIAGSLLSGFVFIPFFGTDAILVTTGILLSLWGLVGMLFFLPEKRGVLPLILFIFLGASILSWQSIPKKDSRVIYAKDGVYEKIKIFDGLWNNKPARFLMQDKSNSAAMYLNSDELVYEYTKYYQLYKLINKDAKRAFIIGGGAYSIPKALLKDSKDILIDVVEIEPELYNLSKKYFNLQDNPRLTNYTEDGRHFLKISDKTYDLIVSDVYYSFFSIPIHFTTKEFFDLAKSRLSKDGTFVGNFVGSLDSASPSFIASEIKTFKEVFPNSYFFGVSKANSNVPQNIIFLGINGDKQIDFKNIPKDVDKTIQDIAQKNINLETFDFFKHKILTDNFSPVEYMVSRVISHWY